MSVGENFADIYLRGMRDRRMRSGTELAREIQLTDRSTAGNLSNRSSGVQIPRDMCTCFGCYLYSTKCSWIIITIILLCTKINYHNANVNVS